MLLFYRRRGIVEILKVVLRDNFSRTTLPMPVPYTNITPAANADTFAELVSFELSSPVCPPKVATFSLRGSACATVVPAKRCHSALSEDAYEVRMV